MKYLNEKLDAIRRLCSANKVKSLFAFGSITREDFSEKSDIDLIVDIDATDPFEYTDYYYNLKEQLQKLFNRNVDLLESRAIRNKFLKQEIDRTKVILYGD